MICTASSSEIGLPYRGCQTLIVSASNSSVIQRGLSEGGKAGAGSGRSFVAMSVPSPEVGYQELARPSCVRHKLCHQAAAHRVAGFVILAASYRSPFRLSIRIFLLPRCLRLQLVDTLHQEFKCKNQTAPPRK
jgi:hypothetical protein